MSGYLNLLNSPTMKNVSKHASREMPRDYSHRAAAEALGVAIRALGDASNPYGSCHILFY